MKRFLLVALVLTIACASHAQLLTWTPEFPKDNDNITITLDATKGNQGLLNYPDNNNVYVHTGVNTNLSTNPSDWKYVNGPGGGAYGSATPALKATYIGNNKYQFTINNIRGFYGVPAGETITRIAILFRDANSNTSLVKKAANADGSDMFIPIYDSKLAVRFTAPPFQPLAIPAPEPITKAVGDNITLSASTNKPATIKINLNGTDIATQTNATSITIAPTLTVAGNNTVLVEANDGTTTVNQTISFFVTSNITTLPLPAGVRDGINYNGSTEATLVLYAPGKTRVTIIGEFAGSNWTEQTQYQMNKTPDGNYWWKTITGLTPGTEYAFQYLVDGTLKIAEPYAEKILDPYNNNDAAISATTYPNLKTYPAGQTGIVSILQTASASYNWSINNFARPDKRNLVTYELLVRDFVAAHDWKTVKDSLNYLKNLGINAIEIMPFNEFEGNQSWGYNPDFYFAPDKFYGPKNTLKEFIDSCHKKGIAVIMDIALNHSFGLSPMVQLYFDNAAGRPSLNNPWFNPVAKHAFNVGYDMNHESAATKYFVSRVTDHWLKEYKIDGFRFDLSKGFTQVQTCDANGGNCNVGSWGNRDASRIAIWKRYYDSLQVQSPGSYAILEHFADNSEEIELSNYGMMLWGNSNYNYNEASMGFLPNSNFESAIHAARSWTNPFLMSYMESHDEERLMYKNLNFGNSSGSYNVKDLNTSLSRMETNAAFFLTIPGPKMIWQFGELGYDFSINRCEDGTINDACRLSPKPIRWDYLQNAQRKKLYDVYAKLNALRFNPAYKDVFIANNTSIERSLGAGFKWLKLRSATDSSMLCVVGNFDVTAQTGQFTFPTAGTWYDHLLGGTFTSTGAAQSITLQPGEYHVYTNRNLNNTSTTPVIDLNNPGALQVFVYPNPTNASVIDLNMPEAGKIIMNLVTIDGRTISNIFEGTLARGRHQKTFGSKLNGVSPGVYLLQIITGNRTKSIKIIVEK